MGGKGKGNVIECVCACVVWCGVVRGCSVCVGSFREALKCKRERHYLHQPFPLTSFPCVIVSACVCTCVHVCFFGAGLFFPDLDFYAAVSYVVLRLPCAAVSYVAVPPFVTWAWS